MADECFFAIYGYAITRPTTVGPFTIFPRFTDLGVAQRSATDSDRFNLTAVGVLTGAVNPLSFFDLAAALTFCQQQWVVISEAGRLPAGTSPQSAFAHFSDTTSVAPHRPRGGCLIGDDSFYPTARQSFLELCLTRLADQAFDAASGFRRAFFRHVESWRLYQPFVDITYYLDFSALEILARTHAGDFVTKNVAELVAPFLQAHGFHLVQHNSNRRELGVQTYAHLRNSLFHDGRFEASPPENQSTVTLRLVDYEHYLRDLVPDVLLRVLGYNDPNINWNRWLDRMPFR
jgi:hypothetical protein